MPRHHDRGRVLGAVLRIALLGCVPVSAAAQTVTVHAGLVELRVAEGLRIQTLLDTASPGAGLRFVPTQDGSVRLEAGSGCAVDFEDRDADGVLETRRIRLDGKLTGRCPSSRGPVSPAFATGRSRLAALDGCRFETVSGGGLDCVREGERRALIRGKAADSLGWHGRLLILDDATGRIYGLADASVANRQPSDAVMSPSLPDTPTVPRVSRLSDVDEGAITAERQAILDKQRESFPRAFADDEAETPQAARAYTGLAARAARRNRDRDRD